MWTNIDELEVEAFPQYLPESIVLDLAKLARIGDGIFIRDVDLGENVTVLDHPEELIVVVQLSKTDEEEVAEAVATEEPEVIEKGKKPEEPEK